jgi:hypothetical protein
MQQPGSSIQRGARLAPGRSASSVLPAGKYHWLVAILAAGASALILFLFYDRSWWAPDDGAYAYVAWRLLEGDVLGRDVADIHPGYINFVNFAAMRAFGVDMLSMRYPLVVLTVAQSVLTYWLLSARGIIVAAVGAIAASALTFVLFANPTANWYALVLALCATGLLSWPRLPLVKMAPALGFLLGSAFLFRQLSAVFLAMGVLCWLILRHRPATGTDRIVVRSTLALVALGLAFYLVSKGSLTALLLFGIWPFFLLAHAWSSSSALASSNEAQPFTVRTLATIIAGAAVACIPLALYNAINGTFGSWLYDSLVAPLLLTGFDFFREASFGVMFIRLAWLSTTSDAIGFANLAYWLTLLLAPATLGARLVVKLRSAGSDGLTPLAVIAVFFGLVSIHYEIPIYLNYTSFLTLAGLLSLELPRREGYLLTGTVAFLCAVALLFQAGQPASRGLNAILTGRTVALDARWAHPLASIRTTSNDRSAIADVLARIERHSPGDQDLLTAPFSPEFYFLAQKRAPFRHGITAVEVQGDADVRRALDALRRNPPAIFVHHREDKYNTPEVLSLVARLSHWAGRREAVGEYDLYFDLDPQRPEGSAP